MQRFNNQEPDNQGLGRDLSVWAKQLLLHADHLLLVSRLEIARAGEVAEIGRAGIVQADQVLVLAYEEENHPPLTNDQQPSV